MRNLFRRLTILLNQYFKNYIVSLVIKKKYFQIYYYSNRCLNKIYSSLKSMLQILVCNLHHYYLQLEEVYSI